MNNTAEIFGCNVFNDDVMRARLSTEVYNAFKQSIKDGIPLDKQLANEIAGAMKDWAVQKGATHYTHWFQPMTGITAEKHDSFIHPVNDGNSITLEFSGKCLIKGEPDASSFPSGGLRATCEARGYTAWDPTSYAFIKDGVLCIPTAFCSYGGEALDKKVPLLRSMEAISKQALRVLKLFGNDDVTSVTTTVGPEQEYFLVDKKYYDQRKDLIYTGRTLFGAPPPKGQEIGDHYFGVIRPRVQEFMKDLNEELWKLGVLATTEHNEAAPAQHELAPIFATTNIATDHNQITMEMMKKIAEKHGLICLLHEKPFEGISGSGKHNNWSMCTNTGVNLLEPGKTPYENAQFLLFLCAVIKAVDEYQDLLRASVASASNDHRLGGNEAPPAIVSMFLGDELTEILNTIEDDSCYHKKASVRMEVGVHAMPTFRKDTTDRNRTSPFAFTGNKFEFRMPGSSISVSGPNVIINTAVADVLCGFADELEKADDFTTSLNALIKRTIHEHRRIIFNGNNYAGEWVKEAEVRGLLNMASTPQALPCLLAPKNIALFARTKVFTETELKSRLEILLDNYIRTIKIEAKTMVDMAKTEILPSAIKYSKLLCDEVIAKRNVCNEINCCVEEDSIKYINACCIEINDSIAELISKLQAATAIADKQASADALCSSVIPVMNKLRKAADEMEPLIADDYKPFPDYGKLLYGI